MLELQPWLQFASPSLSPSPSPLVPQHPQFPPSALLYRHRFLLFGEGDGHEFAAALDEDSPGVLPLQPFLHPSDIDLITAAEIDEWIRDPDSDFDSVNASPTAAAEEVVEVASEAMLVVVEEDGNERIDRETDGRESIGAADGYGHSELGLGFAVEGCHESPKAPSGVSKDVVVAEEMDGNRQMDREKGECENINAADGYGHSKLCLGFSEGLLDPRKTLTEASNEKDRIKQVDREKDEHKSITANGYGCSKLVLGFAEGCHDPRKIPTVVSKDLMVEEEKDSNKQTRREKGEHDSITANGCSRNKFILGIAEGFLDPQKTLTEVLKEAKAAEKDVIKQTDRENEKCKSKQRGERDCEIQAVMGDADKNKQYSRNRGSKTEANDGEGRTVDKIEEPTDEFQHRDQRVRREGIMKEADESKGIINRKIGVKMETENGSVQNEEYGYSFSKGMVGEEHGAQKMEVDKVEMEDMSSQESGLARIKEISMEEERKGIVLDAEKEKLSILQSKNGITLPEDGHQSSSSLSSPLSAMEVEMHMVGSTVSCGNSFLETDRKAIDYISSRLEGQKISNKCRILSKGDSDAESGEIRVEHESAGEETESDGTEILSADDSLETSSSIDSEVECQVQKKQISHQLRRVVTTKKCGPTNEVDSDIDSEDEENKCPSLSQNELQLPPVPPVGVRLEPHHIALPVGVIFSIIESNLVVEVTEAQQPLSEGSILWLTELRCPLGYIDEIFGPVKKPFYVVRYNNPSDVPAAAKVGVSVAVVPDFATFVLNDPNLYKKGYDASGENDEELSESEAEFSDDAKEAEYKSSKARSKRRHCEKEREEDELWDHSPLNRGNQRHRNGALDRRDLQQVYSVPLHSFKQDPHLEDNSCSEVSFKGRCALLEPNRCASPLPQLPLQQFQHCGEPKSSPPNKKPIQVQPPLPPLPLPPQYDSNKEKFVKVPFLQEPPPTRRHGQYRRRWEDRDPVNDSSSQLQNGFSNTGQKKESQLGEHQHQQCGNEEKKPSQTAGYGGMSVNALHPHIQRTAPHPPSPAPPKHEAYNEQLPQYNKQYVHENYENPGQVSSSLDGFRDTRSINDVTTSASPLLQHVHSCGGNEEPQKSFRLPPQPRCGGMSATSHSPSQCRSGGSTSVNNSPQPPLSLPQARPQSDLHLPPPPRYDRHHHSNNQNPLLLDLSSYEQFPQHHHRCRHMGPRNDGPPSAPSLQQHMFRHGRNEEWNYNGSMQYPTPYCHSSSQPPYQNASHPHENGGFGASLNNPPHCSTHPPTPNNPLHCSTHPPTPNNPPHCSSHPPTLNNPPHCSSHPPTLNNPSHCSAHPPTLNYPPHCLTHPPTQGSWQVGGYHTNVAHYYPHLPTPQIGTGFVVQGFPASFASQNPQSYYTTQPPMDPGTVLGVPAGPINSYPSNFTHKQTPYHHQTMGQFANPHPPQQFAPNAISPYQGHFIPQM